MLVFWAVELSFCSLSSFCCSCNWSRQGIGVCDLSLVNTSNADNQDGETFSPCSDFPFLFVLLRGQNAKPSPSFLKASAHLCRAGYC